ncbi:hypothetical protein SODALDRAFT_363215 [Sodiomyces alkalinus F11]|uniref:Uncharacterized protein n=1 Tax=Sodiomyces alkalinus (strain CBS 110278 / VKM F-3762 / F11) TaxID=1314773 RepID=A0A3N2PLJ6_SODAK|nr:hypothetical protein SODALDRAFT_363215 [Sodiomyces alkalinus F11]ROT35393.1 hypothetical protein SODALDRAFT_363215 [Sodiomyces alkalinus F11]
MFMTDTLPPPLLSPPPCWSTRGRFCGHFPLAGKSGTARAGAELQIDHELQSIPQEIYNSRDPTNPEEREVAPLPVPPVSISLAPGSPIIVEEECIVYDATLRSLWAPSLANKEAKGVETPTKVTPQLLGRIVERSILSASPDDPERPGLREGDSNNPARGGGGSARGLSRFFKSRFPLQLAQTRSSLAFRCPSWPRKRFLAGLLEVLNIFMHHFRRSPFPVHSSSNQKFANTGAKRLRCTAGKPSGPSKDTTKSTLNAVVGSPPSHSLHPHHAAPRVLNRSPPTSMNRDHFTRNTFRF